jgi:hypothetical protein
VWVTIARLVTDRACLPESESHGLMLGTSSFCIVAICPAMVHPLSLYGIIVTTFHRRTTIIVMASHRRAPIIIVPAAISTSTTTTPGLFWCCALAIKATSVLEPFLYEHPRILAWCTVPMSSWSDSDLAAAVTVDRVAQCLSNWRLSSVRTVNHGSQLCENRVLTLFISTHL